jgi:hypothetical protein
MALNVVSKEKERIMKEIKIKTIQGKASIVREVFVRICGAGYFEYTGAFVGGGKGYMVSTSDIPALEKGLKPYIRSFEII